MKCFIFIYHLKKIILFLIISFIKTPENVGMFLKWRKTIFIQFHIKERAN